MSIITSIRVSGSESATGIEYISGLTVEFSNIRFKNSILKFHVHGLFNIKYSMEEVTR